MPPYLTRPPLKKIPRSGKILAGFTLILAVLLVIVLTVPFFADWVYLKFILICGLGVANLGIWYKIKTT